jgi:S1-C subfamily serine protease
MRHVLIVIALLTSGAAAQSISLSGRVINEYQNPLSGCIVTLSSNGLKDTTDAEGKFKISNITTGMNSSTEKILYDRPQITTSSIRFSALKRSPVKLSVFDLNGRMIFSWVSRELNTGNYEMPLQSLIGNKIGNGSYIACLSVGERKTTTKLLLANSHASFSTGTPHSNASKLINMQALSKKMATIDTLTIQINKYKTRKIPVTSYISELGDIVMEIESTNTPPRQPQPVFPTSGQQNISDAFTLKWECSDENNDLLKYTVLLDTISPPSKIICNAILQDSVKVDSMISGKTYYWRVVASDGKDSTRSQIFSFSVMQKKWEDMVPELRKQCYIIGLESQGKIIGVGSGFAISSQAIMTNAHVVNALIEIAQSYNTAELKFVAVRDGGKLGTEFSYELDKYSVHPFYDSTTNYTYDFGILSIKSGTISNIATFETIENLLNLSAGDEIATIGFPGETNDLSTIQPIATFKSGTVSALRPFDPDKTPSNKQTNVVIQHNFNTTGGTSGSPIFNKSGKVIAIHNSGEYDFIKNSDNTWTRIPVGSLGYAIRIDQNESIKSVTLTPFSSIQPKKVYYSFINGTLTDMEFYYKGVLMDTIKWGDTLTYWGYKSEPVKDVIELYSIVATKNYLYWIDTMQTGVDFNRRYYVSDDYFLLGITNSTNKVLNSCVVSNSLQYDSSSVYLPIGGYTDVGYYKASSLTAFRLYFNSSTQYIYWNDMDTRSTTDEAKYVPLKATLSLAKQAASMDQLKTCKKHSKKMYSRDELLKKVN